MITTIFLSVIMMVGFFLMLLSAVGFIQDKKLFTSAPKEVQEAVLPRDERFPGAHAIGWIMLAAAVLMMIFPLIYGGIDGMSNDYNFMQYFIRFAVMFMLLKAFDIFFFDWFLLCHSNFFQHYYPETKPYLGPQQFGFNKKDHVVQIVGMIAASVVIAGVLAMVG